MARPESIADIDPEPIEFGYVEVDKINIDGTLLKAYGTFMEAVQKGGGTVVPTNYGRVNFTRPPTLKEQCDQLSTAQTAWDTNQKNYETMQAVGKLEYNYQMDACRAWAEDEGLVWPPVHQPIEPLDAVIRDIDDLVEAN